MGELQTLSDVKSKIELEIELAKRKQDISVFQQIVEPLAEALEELSTSIQEAKIVTVKPSTEPEYFDKSLNKNVTDSLNKVFNLLQKFKQIDLSPINSIASEIKRQNESIIILLNKLGNNQSDELYKLIVAMVSKQNAFIEKGFNQIDYSKQLNEIINKKEERVEKLEVVYGSGGFIQEVKPIYKTK